MKFARNVFISTVFISSFAGHAQQANGTFPAIIRIADKTSNSTARIADTLEASRAYLPEILQEIKLIREQGERSGALVEVRTSLGYWASVVSIGTTIVFTYIGVYNLASYFFNKYYPTATTIIQHQGPEPTVPVNLVDIVSNP
jgi:hypothetical protein